MKDCIRILIAEKDATIRECLRHSITDDQYLSIDWETDNGIEAVYIAKNFLPDVVLLNADLPRMDGIEAARCIRQTAPNLPIVIMSIYEERRKEALEAGANAFVIKDHGCDAIFKFLREMGRIKISDTSTRRSPVNSTDNRVYSSGEDIRKG